MNIKWIKLTYANQIINFNLNMLSVVTVASYGELYVYTIGDRQGFTVDDTPENRKVLGI